LVVTTLLVTASLRPPLANSQAPPLQTVAEKSDYKATSRYADVVAFCDDLAKQSPLVRVETFGTTFQGRKLPVMVVADPPVNEPEEARKSGKLVVLAFANIHAGEVDGKEALLALARDLATRKGHPLLKDLVIVLVPILNADGNEAVGPAERNRPGQNGPAEVGTRENAQGFDLNRDFVKLESPEVRGLVKLIHAWDPAVVVDCHTTNGSKHRFALTYDGPRYPYGESVLSTWGNDTLLQDATRRVKKETGYDIGPYGNFSPDRTKWETYPAGPRFGVQYFSLCGRIGILSESYSYASFQDRVKASYAFVKGCFEVAAEKKDWVLKVVDSGPPRPDYVPVRTKTVAYPGKLTVPGFEEVVKDGRRVATDKPKDYQLEYVARVTPDQVVARPQMGYLIPPEHAAAVDTLRRHGIKVEELLEDIQLDVEAYQVRAVDVQARPFQKHNLVTVEVNKRSDKRMIPAGTVLVRTTQPLGTLAAYLLEPQSEDGLVTWGFFNDGLVPGKDFPVLRLPKDFPVVTGSLRPLPEDQLKDQPITDEVVLARGPQFLQGNPVAGITWLPDGEHFLQTKDGKLMKVEARTGNAEPFIDPAMVRKSLMAIKELDPATVEQMAKDPPSRMNPTRTGFVFSMGTDLAIAYFDGRPAVRLTTMAAANRQFLSISPDGNRVAYVRGQNLFAASADDPGERQLTTDGGGDVFNGLGDWVYEEEIFLRANRGAYWWSPDGKQIAFMRIDDAPVPRFNVVDLQPVRGKLESTAYPKVGDPNPTVKIGVVPTTGGKPVFLDMTGYPPEDTVIARVGWLPDGKSVFAYVQNRTQTWLDFVVWESPTARPRVVFRETTKAWVEDLGAPHFLSDGSFLIHCERSGWKHVYHYRTDGKLLAQITSGEWEARSVARVDEKEGWVYFTGTKDGHTRSNLYRAPLDGSGKVERLTVGDGTHGVSLAPAGSLYLDRYSDEKTPPQLRLLEFGSEKPVRTLDKNPVYEKEQFKFGKYERVHVPMADGFVLEGAVTYPTDFDPQKKYPIWVMTYGGPNAPTVRDGWVSGSRGGMEQSLANSGIVVFRVDPRSASGQGASATWACYKQLGVQELKDLEEAVAWICKNPWADPTRVGLSGHSYGGFMAAFALTHSKVFSAGIAGSAVTDWRLYDSIYTERYMQTPKENPEGYDKTSCVKAAKNLHGRLLITHGMIDDNVHVQNATQFVYALQQSNKDFEMMFYPQSRHGIFSPHYSRLELEFIRRTMGVKK
jgi:dipeptidyl aminopeptidase/acylaminoacyl peptidase